MEPESEPEPLLQQRLAAAAAYTNCCHPPHGFCLQCTSCIFRSRCESLCCPAQDEGSIGRISAPHGGEQLRGAALVNVAKKGLSMLSPRGTPRNTPPGKER